MERNPANFYGSNRGYLLNHNISNKGISQPSNIQRENSPWNPTIQHTNQKPRTSSFTSRPINQEELNNAKEALKLLKAKQSINPKKFSKPNLLINQDLNTLNNNKRAPIGLNNKENNFPQFGAKMGNNIDYNNYNGYKGNSNLQYNNGYNNNINNNQLNNQFNRNINQQKPSNMRKPLMGMINFGGERNVGYNNKYNNNNMNNFNSSNLNNYANDFNYNKYNSNISNINNNINNLYAQHQSNIYNPILPNYTSNRNEQNNDERPLDLGENVDQTKEHVNANEGEPTFPCPDCGRKFVQAVLNKHISICKNVFQSKRKEFNIKNKRIEPEQGELMKRGQYKERKDSRFNKNTKKKSNDIPKWKKQSEEFRKIIHATDKEAEANVNKPSILTDEYKLCKYCNRRYNEEAYAKHSPGCERRFREAMLKGKISKEQYNKVLGIEKIQKKKKW